VKTDRSDFIQIMKSQQSIDGKSYRKMQKRPHPNFVSGVAGALKWKWQNTPQHGFVVEIFGFSPYKLLPPLSP
jgi:hypothetical protein